MKAGGRIGNKNLSQPMEEKLERKCLFQGGMLGKVFKVCSTQSPLRCNHKGDPEPRLSNKRGQEDPEQQGRGTHLEKGGKLKIHLMSAAPLRFAQRLGQAEGSLLGISKAISIQNGW